jgi:hypothetical protein
VNQIDPSGATTTSLGELSGFPRQLSARISAVPVARSTAVIAAGAVRLPCSHTSNRPSRPSVMPLAAVSVSRTVSIAPPARSSLRMATNGRDVVKYSACSSAT